MIITTFTTTINHNRNDRYHHYHHLRQQEHLTTTITTISGAERAVKTASTRRRIALWRAHETTRTLPEKVWTIEWVVLRNNCVKLRNKVQEKCIFLTYSHKVGSCDLSAVCMSAYLYVRVSVNPLTNF